MERKIGEIFEYNGEWYQCIRSSDCPKCDLKIIKDCRLKFPCESLQREDCEEVIFKKLEKVGEPYEHYGKLYQCYKLPMETEIRLLPDNCYPIGKDNLVEIEIKQNKENNMEEKKLNLKPFDIQKAREGKPVYTRDGRKARIVCFDREFIHKGQNYCIVALIKDGPYSESLYSYTEDGLFSPNKIHNYDLMMLSEKKEGWINIYNADTTFYYADGRVFETKDEAVQEAKEKVEKEQKEKNEYVDTIKITWEG